MIRVRLFLICAWFCVAGVTVASDWEWIGPGVGTVTTLATHPSDPQVALAGTEFGGIFRTEDGGDSWSHVGLRGLTISAIEFSKANPNFIYCGTRRWSRNEILPGAVFVSVNAGRDWSAARDGMEDFDPPGTTDWSHYVEIRDLSIDPTDPLTVWAAAERGLFKTTDAGQTWLKILPFGSEDVYSVVVTETDPQEVFVSWPGHGVVKSTDGGLTWADAWAGLPYDNLWESLYEPFVEMLEAPWDPGTVFGRIWAHGIFRYDQNDRMWRVSMSGHQDFLKAGPDETHDLWSGNDMAGLIHSTDGGLSWFSPESFGLGCDDHGSSIPIRALAVFGGTGERLIAANSTKGFLRSFDGGMSWQSSSDGLANGTVQTLRVDRTQPESIIAGTNGHGLFLSVPDGGWTERLSRDVFPCAYWDPGPFGIPFPNCWAWKEVRETPQNTIAVRGGCGMYLSHDHGLTWEEADDAFRWPYGRSTDGRLWYVGDQSGFFRGDGNPVNWEACGPLRPSDFGEDTITRVVFHDDAPDVVIVVRYNKMYRSDDGCQTWQQTGAEVYDCDPFYQTYPHWAGADPYDPRRFFVSNGCGFWESTDGAVNWHRTGFSEEIVNDMVFDQIRQGVVYSATEDRGVLYSTNFGQSWHPLGQGLGEGSVLDIDLHPDGSALFAAVYENGVFRLKLPDRFQRYFEQSVE